MRFVSMNGILDRSASRRCFLKFLAGSPLLMALGLPACSGEDRWEPGGERAVPGDLIATADKALNVFDFERAARETLSPAHYGFLATGVDDEVTLRANREGFAAIRLRPRRLVDVSVVDTGVELFGVRHPTPIVLAPAGSQRAFHPRGEIATANAARTRNHLQILSTISTTSVEAVAKARNAPVWFQLYPTEDWNISQALLARAGAAGCPVVVLTVDYVAKSNKETLQRFKRADPRDCEQCHAPGLQGMIRRKPMFDGLDLRHLETLRAPHLTWEFVDRLRDQTDMKVVLKGIVTREDAGLCLRHGVDGIIVSNHGGRSVESGRATIESLPEVVEAVAGRIPVLMDSGVRRGTDIFKALALGADAICIGRPYLWGLAAFGQVGVEAVLDILRGELELVMKLSGVASLEEIGSEFLAPPTLR